MESCPPEILIKIFLLACTDHGYTGRCLSRVSRYVRSSSEGVRFNSIALVHSQQLLSFAKILADQSPGSIRIQTLFVRAHTGDWAPEPGGTASGALVGGARKMFKKLRSNSAVVEHITARLFKREDEDREVASLRRTQALQEAFTRVLSAAAHTLKALTVIMASATSEQLLPVALPVLEELTLSCPISRPSVLNTDPDSDVGPFLSLKRLNIIGRCLHPPEYIPKAAPRLEYLRLSRMFVTITFVHRFPAMTTLPGDGCGAQPAPLWPHFLPSLQHVILEPVPEYHNPGALREYFTYLHNLPPAMHHFPGRLTVLWDNFDGRGGSEGARMVFQDWLDRNDGGPGCWLDDDRPDSRQSERLFFEHDRSTASL